MVEFVTLDRCAFENRVLYQRIHMLLLQCTAISEDCKVVRSLELLVLERTLVIHLLKKVLSRML